MSPEEKRNEHLEDERHHEDGRKVHITIDGQCIEIHSGEHKVSEIKHLGKIPEAYVLVQDEHGRLVPLADDGKVKIKGCEIFESHPREGGSS